MPPVTHPPATLDDLMRIDGKAELIAGRIVKAMPSGVLPIRVARKIVRALEDFAGPIGLGEVFGDNLGYAIAPPLPSGRQSFSPDASLYRGPLPANLMNFIVGPPTFAVEVRSKNDYGPAADREYADKRKDYFFAGTLVVWDVDPVGRTISRYTSADPLAPVVFGPGDAADAEPAVPGWRLPVDAVFA